VDAIRGLIDDYNNAEMAALEYKIKEFEYNSLSETQKLEIEKLKQDIKLNNISASQAAAQLKLQQDKFNFDKEQQLSETERAEYNNYVNMVDSSSFISQDADGVTQVSDKTGLRNYIIGLNLDDNVTDSLLLRYGLPIN
jgi:replication initiation and membrane attachment protein DnaB